MSSKMEKEISERERSEKRAMEAEAMTVRIRSEKSILEEKIKEKDLHLTEQNKIQERLEKENLDLNQSIMNMETNAARLNQENQGLERSLHNEMDNVSNLERKLKENQKEFLQTNAIQSNLEGEKSTLIEELEDLKEEIQCLKVNQCWIMCFVDFIYSFFIVILDHVLFSLLFLK